MPIPTAELTTRLSFIANAETLAALVLRGDKDAFFWSAKPVFKAVTRQTLKTGDAHAQNAMVNAIEQLAFRRWDNLRDFTANTGDSAQAQALPPARRLMVKLGHLAMDARGEVLADLTWKGNRPHSLDFAWNAEGSGQGPPELADAAPGPDQLAEEADSRRWGLARLQAADPGESTLALRSTCYAKLAEVLDNDGETAVRLTPAQRDFGFRNGTRTLGEVIASFLADFKAKRNLLGTLYGTKRPGNDSLDDHDAKRAVFAKANAVVAFLGSDEDLAQRFGLAGTPKQNRDAIQQWRRQSNLFFQGGIQRAA